MLFSELSGRDVALLGAGRETMAVRREWRQRNPGQRLTVYAEQRPADSLVTELAATGDVLQLGAFDGSRLSSHQVLVRSPGVSPYRAELRAASSAGVAITTASNLWFAEHPSAKTMVITGTKGKSTTAALTAHLLNASGLRAVACGNIGQPMLDVNAAAVDWWVIELSSYQLSDLKAAPSLACITNLSPEHLDWHGGWTQYRADKLRLAELVGPGALVLNHADPGLGEFSRARAGLRWFNHADGWQVRSGRLACADDSEPELTLPGAPGAHNLSNLAAALTLCEAVTTLPRPLQPILDGYRGLPHRLHSLGERAGLRYVDDSLATTPVATLAALEALRGAPVTVLVGGMDRGLDWRVHATAFQQLQPFALVALPDNGPHILAQLAAGGLDPAGGLLQASGLSEAVDLARRVTPRGGVILLSPGAPSFPHFADYRERGEAFARFAGMGIGRGNS
jgi:UDP-N-acetylmuramoylalanine--D-glutamate ligase